MSLFRLDASINPATSSSRAIADIVESEWLAANPDDPKTVVEAIRGVLQDTEQLRNMGLRAREIAFSYDRVSQLKIFTQTLEEVVRE